MYTRHIYLVLLSVVYQVYGGPLCFSCSTIGEARFCDYTERCNDHQVCFVQKVRTRSGHFEFTSGCLSNTSCVYSKRNIDNQVSHGVVTCLECCHGDMCNNKGCGDPGLPLRQDRGPLCFKCNHSEDPSYCEQLVLCETEQVCSVEENVSSIVGSQYTSGCRSKYACGSENLFGKRDYYEKRASGLCQQCCTEDFCNHGCPSNSQVVSSTTTTRTTEKTTPATTTAAVITTTTRPRVYLSCKDGYDHGLRTDGIYNIRPLNVTFSAFCDMSDGGWTVIQHRANGTLNFTQNYQKYEDGFGSLYGEHWLGLENMWMLCNSNRPCSVCFELVTNESDTLHLCYPNVTLGDRSTQYTLYNDHYEYNGHNVSYAFFYNHGKTFYTYDNNKNGHCATFGGWWYDNCSLININGAYNTNEHGIGRDMVIYYNGKFIPLRMSTMKVE